MNESSHPDRDTVGRFSGLAAVYDNHRPDYPPAAIDFIVLSCNLETGRTLVDIGCGTGISSRQFAQRGLAVIGVEPNGEMRQTAITMGGPVDYREGRADNTGLPNESADGVLAAQAFHWFANDATLTEFRRVLKPGRWVALMWNEPEQADAFSAGYSDLLTRFSPDRELAQLWQSRTGEHLLQSPVFEQASRTEFAHQQSLTAEQLLGRAASVSFGPREPEARRQLGAELRTLHSTFAVKGAAVMRYRTSVYLARKPLVPS
jgi:ubiquinone/menaquinone biosynthesis C-methylase UbiE